jgi:tight adherence protein C
MGLSIVLMIGLAAAFGCVGLLVLAVALPPTRGERLLRTLAMFGTSRGKLRDDRGPTWDQRIRAGVGAGFDRLGRLITPVTARTRLIRLLDYAGNPDDRPIDRVIRRRGEFLLAAGAAGLLLGLVAGKPAVAVLGGVAAGILGMFIPDIAIYDLGNRRQKALARSLPDVLDALVIGVEAGLGLDAAMAQVADNLTGPMPSEVHRVLQEMRIGISRSDALRSLSRRTTVRELQSFVTAVIQAGELGVPIANVLREHARDQRIRRRQKAEELAQKVPVKLLFPVLFCLFPVIFVVILGPGVVRLIQVLGSR